MKYTLIIAIACLNIQLSSAQNCSCEDKLRFVKAQVEANYAGFHDKVNSDNIQVYESLTQAYFDSAKKINRSSSCFILLTDWLKFFKDGHVQIAGNIETGEPDSISLQERIKNAETIDLSPAKLKELKQSPIPEEGIYINDDSTYTVAIVSNKTDYRDFVGIIIDSKTDLWKKGQVKIEIRKRGKHQYSALVYLRDHSYRVREFTFDGTTFNGEWIKMLPKPARPHKNQHAGFENLLAKKINESTLYVQIASFDMSNAASIDSLFKANETLLKSTRNLIIDLRGNGGGSDFSFHPILPYIYTHPVISIGVDVWSTEDNINAWRSMILESPDVPAESKEGIKTLLTEMEHNTGKFVNSAGDDTLILDKVLPFPKKVVILVDKHCGSTTEEFLLIAKQSSKVTIMGEQTGGVLDYANVRFSKPSPCKDITLFYATTRSRRIDKGMAIDNIGIKPKIVLSKDKDWIAEAARYLSIK